MVTLSLYIKYWTKLNICVCYDPAIPALAVYSSEMWKYIHEDACTRIFIVALSINSPQLGTIQVPSTVKCIVKINCRIVTLWNTGWYEWIQ